MNERRLTLDRVRGHSFIGSWLQQTDTVLDLGMNTGDFSRTIQHKYGCNIIGVEANPALAARISLRERFVCYNRALTGSPGPVNFFVYPHNLEESSLLCRSDEAATVHRISVQSITPSELLDKCHGRIGLAKMDIEGAEVGLLSLQNLSWLDRIEQLTVEFHSFLYPSLLPKVRFILQTMSARGFYWIDFTTNFADVLFINERMSELSIYDKMRLEAAKYRYGAASRTSQIMKVMRRCFTGLTERH